MKNYYFLFHFIREIKLLKVARTIIEAMSLAPYGLKESFTRLVNPLITIGLSFGKKYDEGM